MAKRFVPASLLIICVAILSLLLTNGGSATAAAAAKNVGKGTGVAALELKIKLYRQAHPGDIVGLDRFEQSLGATPMMTLDRATGRLIPVAQRSPNGSPFIPMSTPTDAFNLTGPYANWWGPGCGAGCSNAWRIEGDWNYRDNYVNGSDPDNVSSVAGSGVCFRAGDTFFGVYDYKGGNHTSLAYLYDAELNGSSVVRINDSVSGFMLYSDNGWHATWFVKASGCYNNNFYAKYLYEHNQAGGSITGIDFSWPSLTVHYSTSVDRLQKSTGQIYLNSH